MNYVFQILKENDQFEFLLGKGLDKVCFNIYYIIIYITAYKISNSL